MNTNPMELTRTLEKLLEIIEQASQLETGSPPPSIPLDEFSGLEREVAASILKLLERHHALQERYRHTLAMMLEDADGLGETLGRIGLGDFDFPVSEVQLSGLETIRIGIEDMVRQLKNSQEKLNSTIDELRQSEQRFRNLVESCNDWIWEVDMDGVYRYASPQVEQILGYRPDEVVGHTPFELMPQEEGGKFASAFEQWKHSAMPINALVNTNLHKDGTQVFLETSGVPFFDSDGQVVGYRGIDRDISERKRMEDKLRHMATHDTLTKLFNRQAFLHSIEAEVYRAERYHNPLTLMLLDIDHFKNVNDSFGHGVGDEVLSRFASILDRSMRKTDFVARYGGEEFTAILPETSVKEATEMAERLRRQLFESPFHVNDSEEIHLSASIGIATFPRHADNWEALIEAADAAMYAAKRAGRNRIMTPDEEPEAEDPA
ncbi:MAG: sensor domain-containing diguanylate cyclase [Sedimenticola sp.]